jgi:Cdc6-like AAA superfamily ATPase
MVSPSTPLFDPGYLPDRLLHREQELGTLSKLLPSGDFAQAVNILVHGSYGIGRTTLLRFFGLHQLGPCRRPLVSFHMKSAAEIVFDTLTALVGSPAPSNPLPELWSSLKRILQKTEAPIVFILDDVDRSSVETYGKYLAICKEFGIPSMSTAPRYFQRSLPAATSQHLDYSLELQSYSDHEFLDIVTDRVSAAFPVPFGPSTVEFIADLVCLLDYQRPATAVELLRMLYPIVGRNGNLTADQIRQTCLSSGTLHYDYWSDHMTSVTNLDARSILLLQAAGEYFLYNAGRLYVSKLCLFQQYEQVCERVGITPSTGQFTHALNELLFQDLLLRSRYNSDNYFTLFPAQNCVEVVDLLLGDAEEC